MEINKETKQKFEDFLIKMDELKISEIPFILFRRHFLLKETPELSMKNVKKYKKIANSTKINKETLFLIEQSILKNKYLSFFFKLLNSTNTKISDETLKKICEYTLSKKISSDCAHSLCFYIESLNLKGYCNFFKELIDMLVKNRDYQVWAIILVAGEMGCLNCYESIERLLMFGDKNGRALYCASEVLKELDRLRVTKETELKFERFMQKVMDYKNKNESFTFEDFLKIYKKEIGLIEPKEYIANIIPRLISMYFINLDGRDLVMIEKTLLKTNMSWTWPYFFKLLILLETKISDKTLKILCEYSLEKKVSPEAIKSFVNYIKELDLWGYDNFIKKVI